MLNNENIVRVIDGMIGVLQDFRQEIAQRDSTALQDSLEKAREGRELWWQQRVAANWAAEEIDTSKVEVPKSSEMLGRFIGLGRKKKPKK